jgi:hypothetical protein
MHSGLHTTVRGIFPIAIPTEVWLLRTREDSDCDSVIFAMCKKRSTETKSLQGRWSPAKKRKLIGDLFMASRALWLRGCGEVDSVELIGAVLSELP